MHRIGSGLLLALLTFAFWLPAGDQAAEQPTIAPVVANRVLVAFRAGTSVAAARAAVEAAGGRLISSFDEINGAAVAPAAADADRVIAALQSDTRVLAAGYDRVVRTADVLGDGTGQPFVTGSAPQHPGGPIVGAPYPDIPDWFYTSTPAQWSVKRIGARGDPFSALTGAGAWDTTRGAGVKIAIIDTGVSSIHPDIAPNLIAHVSVVGADPTPCDDGSPEDQVGHGTWTASLAAGAIGGGLIVGVAPEAKIIGIKALVRVPADPPAPPMPDPGLAVRCNGAPGSTGEGTFEWVLKGLLEADRLGADIVSMSFGAFQARFEPGSNAAPANWVLLTRLTNYLTRRGRLLIASAGNGGMDLDRQRSLLEVPAQLPNVISVVATTNPACREDFSPDAVCTPGPDALAFYSNYGARLHGLAAPGGTRSPGRGGPPSSNPLANTAFVVGACSVGIPGRNQGLPSDGGTYGCMIWGQRWYAQMAGTSASAPHAAGVAALIKSANPWMTPSQLRARLQQTAEDIGPFRLFNFGLVDADAAVTRK